MSALTRGGRARGGRARGGPLTVGRPGLLTVGRSGLVALAAAALVVTLAGCGGGVDATFGQYPTTTTPGVTLSTEQSPVGPILTTGTGYTLYDFVPDTPSHSACTSATCVLLWPPLTVTGSPDVGTHLRQSLVGTLRRPDGSTQVTYGGHPLYRWNADIRPGLVTGQGVVNEGGPWYVVGPSGQQITTPFSVGGP